MVKQLLREYLLIERRKMRKTNRRVKKTGAKCPPGTYDTGDGYCEPKKKKLKLLKSIKTDKQAYYKIDDKEIIKKDLGSVLDKVMFGKLKPEFDINKDNFIKATPEVLEAIKNGDTKYPQVAINKNMFDVKINLNKFATTLVTGKQMNVSGSISDAIVRNPVYDQYNQYIKHKRVSDFINSGTHERVINKLRDNIYSKNIEKATAAGTLLTTALSGQRIGSERGTKAGIYDFVETGEVNKDSTPKLKKEFKGWVDTYGVCTLKAKHIKVDGDNVTFDYLGKLAEHQNHIIKDKALADFYDRKLRGLNPEEYLHSKETYNDATKTIDKITKGKYKIKDFRTVVAHNEVPKKRDEYIARFGIPKTDKEKKAMVKFACEETAKILGNKWTEVKKSYANPQHISNMTNFGTI